MAFKENKTVISAIIGIAILLFLIFIIVPPSRNALGVYLFGLVIAFLVYSTKTSQKYLIGLSLTGIKAGRSLLFGIIFGAGFLLATALIPGLSLGYPILPNAISDQVRFFIVTIVAPIAETIIIQGAIFGFLKGLVSTRTAIILQALIFAIAHIAAYVTGFYSYPDFATGFGAVFANISAFFAAFLFALLAGWFVSKDGIKNLLFVIIFHAILNIVIYAKSFSIIALG